MSDVDARRRFAAAERLLRGPLPAGLFDAAGVGRRLSTRLHRLHHRPGRSITRIEVADGDGSRGPDRTLLIAHARIGGPPDGAVTATVADAEVAVWTYPHDPYLPGLAAAADPSRLVAQLREGGLDATHAEVRRRAYRPGRGAVVEVDATVDRRARRLYVKVLPTRRAARLARVHRTLASDLPVPPVIALLDGALVTDGLPGRTLRRAVRRGGPLVVPRDLVRLSTRLARTTADSGRSPERRADPAPHVAALRRDLPDLDRTVGAVVEAARSVGGPRGTVHGDLHGGQLLTADGAVTGLLDLDDVGPGRIAHDAGTLIAYLEVQSDRSPADPTGPTSYARDVAAAYREVVGPRDLAHATAGRWLALAAAAHRAGDEPAVRRRVARAAGLVA